MKLMVLLSRVPYPLDKGDKLRAYHQIKWLSKHHDIYLCCLNDSGEVTTDTISHLKTICKELEIINIPRNKIFLNLFTGFFSNKPFQVKYFYHRFAQNRINEIIDAFQPDHIYCQLIRTAEYVREVHHIPKTIDFMDALSKGIERRIKRSGIFLRPILKAEARRLLRYENLVFEYFDHKTIISEQDRNLIYHEDRNKISVIPNGVDCEYFSPNENIKKQYELVFTGNMNYAPNVDGVEYLANHILPELRKTFPKIKLLISGTNPHKRVLGLQSTTVEVTGRVEDIRTSYNSAKIFIAPMQIGTGLQNKLLEAMAMKLPCITSELVNNALKAKPEHDILIGETPKEYADQIIRLLTDEVLREKISNNGHQFVEKSYNWKLSAEKTKYAIYFITERIIPLFND